MKEIQIKKYKVFAQSVYEVTITCRHCKKDYSFTYISPQNKPFTNEFSNLLGNSKVCAKCKQKYNLKNILSIKLIDVETNFTFRFLTEKGSFIFVTDTNAHQPSNMVKIPFNRKRKETSTPETIYGDTKNCLFKLKNNTNLNKLSLDFCAFIYDNTNASFSNVSLSNEKLKNYFSPSNSNVVKNTRLEIKPTQTLKESEKSILKEKTKENTNKKLSKKEKEKEKELYRDKMSVKMREENLQKIKQYSQILNTIPETPPVENIVNSKNDSKKDKNATQKLELDMYSSVTKSISISQPTSPFVSRIVTATAVLKQYYHYNRSHSGCKNNIWQVTEIDKDLIDVKCVNCQEKMTVLREFFNSNFSSCGNTVSQTISSVDVIVLSGQRRCTNSNHNITDMLARVTVTYRNKPMSRIVNISYCQECNRYTMLKTDYYNLGGTPNCTVKDLVTNSVIYSPNPEEHYLEYSTESIIHSCGYNVNSIINLSPDERRTILVNLIKKQTVTRSQIIEHLEYCIRRNKHKDNMSTAISKWQSDIVYLKSYQPNDIMFVGDIDSITVKKNKYRYR